MMFLCDEIHSWMNDAILKLSSLWPITTNMPLPYFAFLLLSYRTVPLSLWLPGVIVATSDTYNGPFHHSWWESASSHEDMLSISHSELRENSFPLTLKNRYDWLMCFLIVWESSFGIWWQKEQKWLHQFQQLGHMLIELDYIIRSVEVNNLSS